MIVDENDFLVGTNHHIKKGELIYCLEIIYSLVSAGLPLRPCSLTLRHTYSEKVV